MLPVAKERYAFTGSSQNGRDTVVEGMQECVACYLPWYKVWVYYYFCVIRIAISNLDILVSILYCADFIQHIFASLLPSPNWNFNGMSA